MEQLNERIIELMLKCEFVPELIEIQQSLVARRTHSGPADRSGRTRYTYRTVEDIFDAVKDLLAEKKCVLNF